MRLGADPQGASLDTVALQVTDVAVGPRDPSKSYARCYVTATVEEGDVGVLVPVYDTTYMASPTYQLSTGNTGLALGDIREVGVVEFSPSDTGAANTFVNVVTSGKVTAKVMTGTNHSVAATGDALEYSVGGAGAFIKSTLGATSKYCVGVALEPVAVGTVATHKATALVYITRPVITVNTTSTASW